MQYVGAIICLGLALGYAIYFWRTIARGRSFPSLAVTRTRQKMAQPRDWSLLFWTSPIFWLSIVGLFTYLNLVPAIWVPPPHQVLSSLWRLTASGVLPSEAWASIQRILIGFAAAALIGVAVGLLAGAFSAARLLVLPTNSFLRYIPPTAFIALLIVYFGVGETYKYAVIFFGIVFFITQMTIDAVDDIDIKHVEMGKTSGFSTWRIFQRVIVPYSMPRVFDVLRINLSAAWTFLVAAEIIGSDRGLGHLVAVSQRFLRIDDLYVGILSFGLIGMATDVGLDWLSRRWFRWYYVSLGR
jgi:NitT/TauT family transport system permease protein